MRHVAIHLLVYVTVNAVLVVIWLMIGGSAEALASPLEAAREARFWPLWVIVGWGALLVLHTGITAVTSLSRGQDVSGKPWVAVMFTDLTDSTALAGNLGDDAWSEMITGYRGTVREVARTNGGTEIGTQGDGMLIRFDSPAEAVECATAMQRRFAANRDDGGTTPPVRIGVHAGQVVARDQDLLGRVVNLASRVTDVAGPNEIIVTEPVADHARGSAEFDDRGLHPLDGIAEPRHLLAVRWMRA
jgi:class 3 adenylate cyclase